MNWTVGIINSANRVDYLAKTYSSASSNFSDVHVLGEPDVDFDDWSNWIIGLFTLVTIRPKSDYYLMLNDNAVMCRNVRYYLEGTIPQIQPFGAFSIFTSKEYYKKGRIIHNEAHGFQTWESSAIIFSREQAVNFLSNPKILHHNSYELSCNGRKSSKEVALGLWANRENLPIYYHSPSLVKSDSSDTDYVGDNFDCMNLVESPLCVLKNLNSCLF